MKMKLVKLLVLVLWLHKNILAEDEIVNERPYKFQSIYTIEARKELYEKENSMAIGNRINLTDKEKRVNKILMYNKRKELAAAVKNPENFPPARHFFHAKGDIEASEVFSILKQIPKGGNLRTSHAFGTSFEYLYNLTLEEDLYICTDDKGQWYLRFFGENLDENHREWKARCDWKLVQDMRTENPQFDGWIRSKLTLVVDDPYTAYPTTGKVWEAYIERERGIKELLYYWPITAEQFYQMMEETHRDDVMYLEFRSEIAGSYNLNNTAFFLNNVAHWKEVVHILHEYHPTFFGAKVILEKSRDIGGEQLEYLVKNFQQLYLNYSTFLAGLDLGGFEDKTLHLEEVASIIETVPLFSSLLLASGRTNWFGSADDNLLDAVLLGSKRIGHGFALSKHPEVLRLVKERDIAIEVCPISDQVFRYVDDLRNHPAATLFALDYPVVICNDSPALWGITGLSYDWYMAFMAIASRNADLRMLKQLAINSIQYSAMKVEKPEALRYWNLKWNLFIDEFLEEHQDFEFDEAEFEEDYQSDRIFHEEL